MNKNALIIFTKNPEKGKVKTRLAKTVGDDNALNIYKALIHHTVDFSKKANADCFAYYSNEIGGNEYFDEKYFNKQTQFQGDLGERMEHAIHEVLAKGYEKVIIIGSDCYQLTTAIINEGFKQLSTHDFVVGPALDGGYYLMGMKKLLPELYRGKEWSTSTVLEEAIAEMEKVEKSHFKLPTLSDVDYEEDLGPLAELLD